MPSIVRGSDDFDSAVSLGTLRLSNPNGFGAVQTGNRRFSTVVQNTIGASLSYTDDANAGTTLTVLKSGTYAFSYTDAFAAAADINLTKNVIGGPTMGNDNLLAESTTASGAFRGNCAVTVPLVAGDVVRPYSNGTGSSRAFLTVTRVR